MYSVVIYTDGSGRCSLGSYGFFYYIFKNPGDDEVKGVQFGDLKAEFTNKGLLTTINKSEEPDYYNSAKKVKPEFLFAGRRNIKDATNNHMELCCIVDALLHLKKQIEEKDIVVNNVLVRTDSTTSIQRINNVLSGQTETLIPFKDEIKYIYEVFGEKKINIEVNHVYGHASSVGNMFVDRLAYSCGERSEEFKEILDISDIYNKKLEFPWYTFSNSFHIMSADQPTIFVDRYKKGESIGEKRSGRLVGILKPKEFVEPIDILYNKYLKEGDDSVLDIKISASDIKTPTNALFYLICKSDAFDVNPKNTRWFRICGKGVAMSGGNMSGLGTILYNKLDSMLDKYRDGKTVYKIDIKNQFNKSNLKDKNKIDLSVDLSGHDKLCGLELNDEIKDGLKRLKTIPVFPSLNIPPAKFISTVLLDPDSTIELVISNITEILINTFVYIKTEKYGFESVWSDSEIDTVFLK